MEELRDFFENAVDGVHWVGADGTILWANRAELALLGYEAEEYLGRPIAEFHVDQPVIDDILARLRRNEVLRNCEARLRCKDGSIRHVVINSSGLWRDGKFVHTRCVTRDVTDQKRAQEERDRATRHLMVEYAITKLLANETRFDDVAPRLLRTVCDFGGWDVGGVWMVDESARVLRCVDVWHGPDSHVDAFAADTRRRTFSIGIGLPGRVWAEGRSHWVDVTNDPNFPRAPVAASVALRSAAAFPIHVRGRVVGVLEFFSKQRVEADADLLRLFDAIGAQVGQFAERREAEELRDRLAAIVDSSDDAIVSKTLDGVITSWNRGAEHTFGYTASDAIGRHVTLIIPPERHQEEEVILARLRAGQKIEQYETVRQTRDGRLIDVSLTVSPVRNAEGKIVGASKVARDVTERNRAVAALAAANEYLRAVVDGTPACVKIVAADGTLLEMNRAGLEMIEAPSAAAVADACVYDLVAPEHRDAFRAFNERICLGERGALEFEIIGLAGTRRTMETHAVPVAWRDGSRCQLAVTRDITERRRAELALRESEALFRQLADAVPQIIWMTGPTGEPQYYNRRWYEFTGTRPEDAAGSEIVHADDRAAVLEAWRRSIQTGDVYEVELRLREGATGLYRWHLARAVPIADQRGTIVRWVGSSTNIEEQKRAERTSRFMAEASRTVSTLVDYNTALKTVAQLAVPDFADWCAVDMVETSGIVRRLALCHSDPAKVELAFALERRYPARRDAPHGVYEVLRTGRSEIMADIPDRLIEQAAYDAEHLDAIRTLGLRSYIAVPLRAAGRPIGVITFIATDASGRRYDARDLSTAEELADRASIAIENARLYSELQDAARHKDEFLAVLAHELRNPVAPLRTALQLLEVAGDDVARRARACGVMGRQLHQLVRLVDDLLDVSRITRGRIELKKQPVELATILQNAIETSRPMIEANGHQLTVTFPREPIVVDADATRLAQVFANLLNNAAKYTPRGGHIDLAAECDRAVATVRVGDTGTGIPPEMLTRVFDMFVQVDRSFEKTSGGLGIGLTLVKRLVEMHGGTVEARSDGDNKGSEFVVSLPVVSNTRQVVDEPRAAVATVPLSSRRRILVADDNEDAAECLAEALRLIGHDVRTVHDGVAAVSTAEAIRPDIVLLDLGMPRMDGYEAAKRIREQLGPAAVIVAVTGWGQQEDQRRSRAAGFDRHLIKPIDISDVVALTDAISARTR